MHWCPSVWPSVCPVPDPKSGMEGHRKLNLARRKSVIRVTRDPNKRSKGQRSTSPGPLTPWPKISHIFGTRPANFKLVYGQCCDLETMVSRLECTRVHFVQVSVSISRPDGQGLGLGLETWSPRSRSRSRDLKKVLTTTLRMEYDDPRHRHARWPPRWKLWVAESNL